MHHNYLIKNLFVVYVLSVNFSIGCLERVSLTEQLCLGIDTNDVSVVRSCLAQKVCVDTFSRQYGNFPLLLAVEDGHEEIGSLLLDAHADPNPSKPICGTMPLHYAALYGSVGFVEQLLKVKAQVWGADNLGDTPLMYAARSFRLISVMQVLIDAKADIAQRNVDGDTVFFRACQRGPSEVVQYLLDCKASVNERAEPSLDTPLHRTASEGWVAIVNTLLEANADLTLVNKDGDTPLLSAAKSSRLDPMNLLLEKKSDVNHCNTEGRSALYYALLKRHDRLVQLLLSKGARWDALEAATLSDVTKKGVVCEFIWSAICQALAETTALSEDLALVVGGYCLPVTLRKRSRNE